MSAYNKEKKLLFIEVDRLVEKGGLSKESIAYDLQRRTGFSDRTILDYIKKSIEHGRIIEERGVLQKAGVNDETEGNSRA